MAPQDDFLNEVITMMRSLEIHFLATKRLPLPKPPLHQPSPPPHSTANCANATATGKKVPSKPAGGGGSGGGSGAQPHRASPARRRARHSPRRHVCPICDMTFPWLCLLKRHMRTHLSKQLYTCKDCDYTTRDKKDFAKHVLIHTWHRPQYDETKPEVKSGAIRKSRKHRRHDARKSRSKEETGKFKCNQCDMVFRTKGLLMRHINCVHGYPEHPITAGEAESASSCSAT